MLTAVAKLVRRGLAEPLLHFLAAGAAIFLIHAAMATGASRTDLRIELTPADVDRLRSSAARQWGREPEPAQLDGLVEAFVREEVLYREALRRGIDRDDIVVRRRLAQKMEFIAQGDVRSPTEPELRAHFDAHAADYATDDVLEVEQVYFSRRVRGAAADDDASRALGALRAGRDVPGDSLPAGPAPVGVTRAALARTYGAAFADTVAARSTGDWSDPITSPFGVHLVRTVGRRAGAAAFDTVRERVRNDVVAQRVTEAREAAFARARQRYTVVMAGDERARDGHRLAAVESEAAR